MKKFPSAIRFMTTACLFVVRLSCKKLSHSSPWSKESRGPRLWSESRFVADVMIPNFYSVSGSMNILLSDTRLIQPWSYGCRSNFLDVRCFIISIWSYSTESLSNINLFSCWVLSTVINYKGILMHVSAKYPGLTREKQILQKTRSKKLWWDRHQSAESLRQECNISLVNAKFYFCLSEALKDFFKSFPRFQFWYILGGKSQSQPEPPQPQPGNTS